MIIPDKAFAPARPFFLYSEAEIEFSARQVSEFWKSWSLLGFDLFFSVKVNPNPHLLKILGRYVQGFDVSSLAEARLARHNVPSAALTWSGPAKTDFAFDQVADWNLRCFHLDSVDDWTQFRKRMPASTAYSLRLSSSEIHSQKLGFSKAELQKLKQLGGPPSPAVHSYLGRETFSAASMQAFIQRLDEAIESGSVIATPEIFLGAGLPSARLLSAHADSLKPTQAPSRVLHLESGRGLIQSAGSYGTQILSLKKSETGRSAILDGGLQHMATHFLSPRYKAEGVQLRFFRAGQELLDRSDLVSFLGSLSLWHDTMIENVMAPADLRRGDWIVASHMGAYGYAAASNQFLAPSKIQEWLLEKNGNLQDISAPNLVSYQEASR